LAGEAKKTQAALLDSSKQKGEITMTFSIKAQIAEVEREVEMRRDVYKRQVAAGRMRESVAEYRTQCMEAVLLTLKGLDNEPKPAA
jgi:hypothetical protein